MILTTPHILRSLDGVSGQIPTSLWMLYREWVDDVIDGQVGSCLHSTARVLQAAVVDRAPTVRIDRRILQNMVSEIPLVLGLKLRMQEAYVYAIRDHTTLQDIIPFHVILHYTILYITYDATRILMLMSCLWCD